MGPHTIVQKAIKSGVLIREACSRCGATETQAHHEDYSKPLEVIWLCRGCHKQRHAELRRCPNGYVPLPPVGMTYVRFDADAKQDLTRIAEADGRTLHGLLVKIVADWIAARKAGK
jgi:hypothetical protein